MNIFTAENITKRFANHTALDKVSINVPEQTIYGLLGPNGAGKTTLIRIINMITAPDEGNMYYSGRPLHPKDTEFIGYLPEERGLYKKMKVGEQCLYLAQLKGLSQQEAMKRLREWFRKFEIENWWNRKVEELSKGMQQKVQFIITVIHEPRLLIFDEPFSGFDPINVNLLKQEILRMKANGSTIIFSTHNMSSVEELCDNIALINKSKKILEGEMNQIKKAYTSDTYEVEYSGSEDLKSVLPADFDVLEQTSSNGTRWVKIRLLNSRSQNELLQQLMPYVTIHGFREILPTMNDIFIDKVNESEP